MKTLQDYTKFAIYLINIYNSKSSPAYKVELTDELVGKVISKIIDSKKRYDPSKSNKEGGWKSYAKYLVYLVLKDQRVIDSIKRSKEKRLIETGKEYMRMKNSRTIADPLDILIERENRRQDMEAAEKMLANADLSPINEAYVRLLIDGNSIEKIAEASGVTINYVKKSIKSSIAKMKCIK